MLEVNGRTASISQQASAGWHPASGRETHRWCSEGASPSVRVLLSVEQPCDESRSTVFSASQLL